MIEKIKDMWPEMTPEAADMDKVIEAIIPQTPGIGKNDSFEIGNEFAQMPIFEAKEAVVTLWPLLSHCYDSIVTLGALAHASSPLPTPSSALFTSLSARSSAMSCISSSRVSV